MTVDYDRTIPQQELSDLRAEIKLKRRRLTNLEAAIMRGEPIEDAEGNRVTPDQVEADNLRAELASLQQYHARLAEQVEGEVETVRDTLGERAIDFVKDYWIWLALFASLTFMAFAADIAIFASKNTEKEAAELKKGFAGQTMDSIEEVAEEIENLGRVQEQKLQRQMDRLSREVGEE